jgi:hypothetical protein
MEANQIDRNTRDAVAQRRGLAAHARRFILLSVTLLATACSSLKLGYNNADTLLLYSLDSYFDLDDRQEDLARERVRALLGWHRSTQLADYAQLLTEAQRKLDGQVKADEIATLQKQVNARLAVIGDQAAPDLAALALTLTPAQIERFASKLAKESSNARRELVRFAGALESTDKRVQRFTERAESWFGSVNADQAQILRATLAERVTLEAWWMDERERRQHEMAHLLQRIHEEKPPAGEATRRIREYFAQLAEPRDAQRRAALASYRQANAELIARLINAATPAQRTVLAKKLRGYAEDFIALTAETANNGRS